MPARRNSPLPYLVSTVVAVIAVLGAIAGAAETGSTPAPAKRPAFDLSGLDRSVEPCTDFYQFACGTWMKNNPIPPDRGSYGRGRELQEYNLTVLRDILEKASPADPKRSPLLKQVGDFYAACMDEKKADRLGPAPIKGELDKIAALKGKPELAETIARLHRRGTVIVMGRFAGATPLFGFGSQQDFRDARQVIAGMDQSGLGLPDRDYYLSDDPKSQETRKQYQEHLARTFRLLGDAPERAASAAAAVMKIENTLATASLDRVSRREPAKLDHKLSRQEFKALAPSFDWEKYFAGIGAPPFASLNVTHPDFFKGLETALQTASLEDWKDYLRWRVAGAWSPWLGRDFSAAAFDFYGKTLGGAKELPVRWKRCVELTDQSLGEALGQPYVEATFGAEGKARMLSLVHALEKSLEKDINDLPWMTDATRKQALVKLAAITNKIGYPDRWRDYSSVKIARDDLVGNVSRAREFEGRRDLGKIDKPVDKGEWLMSPPTVNAYYDPQNNNINFPAGILQPPYFDLKQDDALNYGAIGMVIGHELTHGFDDQGRQFDADGNLKDWWTEADGKEFEKRASCIVDQYSGYTAVADLKINGKLTLGENTADNGGMRIAYMALMDTLGTAERKPVDGFTPEQRFFLGQAQVWCANVSDEEARLRTLTDPHSLPRYRVNGVVSNMPEFRQAFGCKEDAPMVRADACRVW